MYIFPFLQEQKNNNKGVIYVANNQAYDNHALRARDKETWISYEGWKDKQQ